MITCYTVLNRVKTLKKVRNGEIGSSFYFWKVLFRKIIPIFLTFILLTKTFILLTKSFILLTKIFIFSQKFHFLTKIQFLFSKIVVCQIKNVLTIFYFKLSKGLYNNLKYKKKPFSSRPHFIQSFHAKIISILPIIRHFKLKLKKCIVV